VEITRSAVVALNHDVAIAQTGDLERALETTDRLALELDGYAYLHSTRGDIGTAVGTGDT
jgi:predicted RNA polymerase sigma factor